MSRASAKRSVNIFSGGLVTEASPLNFPENSLSVAYNIELENNGSASSRLPYNKPSRLLTSGSAFVSPWLKVRKYYWKEVGKQLIVFLGTSSIVFAYSTGTAGYTINTFSAPLSMALNQDFLQNNFDIAFTNDSFYFPVCGTVGGVSRSFIYKASVNSSGTLTFSDNYGTAKYYVYEPVTGSNYSRTTPTYYVMLETVSGDPFTYTASWYWDNTLVTTTTGPDTTGVTVGEWTYVGVGTPIVEGTKYYFRIRREKQEESSYAFKGAQPLSYRDFRGLPNPSGLDPTYLNSRPSDERLGSMSAFAAYNLFNAGWKKVSAGDKFSNTDGDDTTTPTYSFAQSVLSTSGKYPSMCDSIYDAYIDTAKEPKCVGLFSPHLLMSRPPLQKVAKKGSHILKVGYEYANNLYDDDSLGSYFVPKYFTSNSNPPLSTAFFSYVSDNINNHKITSISLIRGRLWYGITGREFNIAYSQLNDYEDNFISRDLGNLTNCYQKNNPTDEDANGIIETDGGTISIKEMGEVIKFVEYKNNIVVLAKNGVWIISGDTSSFSPTSFSIYKINDEGILRSEDIISTEVGVFFISNRSLKTLTTDQIGKVEVLDISTAKIHKKATKLFDEFSKSSCASLQYHEEDKLLIVDWVNPIGTSNNLQYLGSHCGLVLDTKTSAYYEYKTSGVNLTSPSSGMMADDGLRFSPAEVAGKFYVCLGLIGNNSKTLDCYYHRGNLTTSSDVITGFSPGTQGFSYTVGERTDKRIDGPTDRDYLSTYNCVLEIPHDIIGDASLSKSSNLCTIFQDGGEEFFKEVVEGGANILIKPLAKLDWKWDWKRDPAYSAVLDGNIRYPEIATYKESEVLCNKVKLAGSGKSLTMSFSTGFEKNTSGFRLLAYFSDLTADTTP